MHSPFEKVLHTNLAPSETECDTIRDLVGGWRKDYTRITADIVRLQSLVDEAARRQEELQHFIDAHLALLSPARRLPDDIIRGIFMEILPSTRNCSLSPDEAPFLLCHICKTWRFIALYTPRLWASIHIVIPTPSRLPQLTDTVVAWLDRSRTVPINVSMSLSLTADPRCDLSALMSALVALSPRWRHMHFSLTTYSYFASLSSHDVPLLQTISFDSAKSYWGDNPTESFMFLATQSLRSVALPSSKTLLQSPISWRSLRHLKITRYGQQVLTHNGVLKILRQCPLLETCDIAVSQHVISSEATIDQLQFSLPHLTHLSVTNGPTNSGVSHFLGSLILPALLSFDCYEDIRLQAIVPSQSLFPSDAFLQCLRVNIRGLNTSVLVAALTAIPTLEEVYILQEPTNISDRYPDSKFLTHLTAPPNRVIPIVCPNLHVLELERFDAVSDDTILQFLQSRTGPLLQFILVEQPIVQLARFSCTFDRSCRRNIMPELQAAIAAGLSVDLKYIPLAKITYSPLEGIELG
ncbi:hypothetical protein B0H19DRAFT_1181334 [Mycena capillaripes]|nr:hypothetical protein B0H19DRAFT_1181334 [Mycena capillaripes]